jgi:hypothetical protein
MIHPEHGLWHSWRGALAFAERIDLPPSAASASPCASCAAKPCLAACPVGAFTADGYDDLVCAGHLAAQAGADCRDDGCRARRACPVAPHLTYETAQNRFHATAFLAGRTAMVTKPQ